MKASITLNGKQVSIPSNFFDVGVKASFGEEIQANLTTEKFTFVLDAYDELINWIKDGRTGGVGIFEGVPCTISKSDDGQNVTVFNGIVDLQEGATIRENLGQIEARLKQDDGLNTLSDLLEPLDYGYLRDIGVIKSSDYVDVDYVVDPIDKAVLTITTLLTIYLLSKQLADTVKELLEIPATVAGITASGATGAVGAAIYAVAVAILRVAYAATLLVLIIDYGVDLFNIVVQPLRQ